MNKAGFAAPAHVSAVILICKIDRFASVNVIPTRGPLSRTRCRKTFDFVVETYGPKSELFLPRCQSPSCGRACPNIASRTWLTVSRGVGACSAECAIGVSQKWTVVGYGMSAFLIGEGYNARGEGPKVYVNVPFY